MGIFARGICWFLALGGETGEKDSMVDPKTGGIKGAHPPNATPHPGNKAPRKDLLRDNDG